VTFSRIKPYGWARNEKITSPQMTQLDINVSTAVDKTGDNAGNGGGISGEIDVLSGGTLNLLSGSSQTIEGGSYITIANDGYVFLNSDAWLLAASGSYMDLAGTNILGNAKVNLTINAGSAITANAGTAVSINGTLYINNVMDIQGGSLTNVNNNATVVYNNGSQQTYESGMTFLTSVWGQWQSTTNRNLNTSFLTGVAATSSSWTYYDNFALSGSVSSNTFLVPLMRCANNATLNTVIVYMKVGNPHAGGVPANFPSIQVIRTDNVTGTAINLSSISGGAQTFGTGFGTAPATGGAWYNSGTMWALTFTCNQNNTIDNTQYTYTAIIVDENGSGSETGNQYYNVSCNSINIPDQSWNI
jgi:hypothetical protein